jgi:hypothetical protein
MTKFRSRAITASKWFLPLFSIGIGVVILAAAWLGGQLAVGLIALVVLTGFGLFVLLAGRSETIRGLRGDGRDERFALIDLTATAISGLVLIITLVVAWLVQIAQGHSGDPYGWLMAIAGLAYLLAVVFLRWRS